MHVDLRTVSWRSVGAGLAGSNDTQAAPTKAQSLLSRALEVHLGVPQREDTYGPPGAFAPVTRNATASPPDIAPEGESTEVPEPDATADSPAASEATELQPEAPVESTGGVVNFGFVQAGAGSLSDYRPSFVDAQGAEVSLFDWDTAGADFSTADWDRIDPNRIGLARGNEVVYGEFQDLGGGAQAVEFSELVDNQGNRFSLTVLVYGAASAAAAAPDATAESSAESPESLESAVDDVSAALDSFGPPAQASAAALTESMADSLQIEQRWQLQQQLLATLPNLIPEPPLASEVDDAGEAGAEDSAPTNASEDAPADGSEPAQALAARLALRLWAAEDGTGVRAPGLDVLA